MATILDIEGVGPAYPEKLKEAGVRSTSTLLKRGGNAKGRKELAYAINIQESKLLKWVYQADLFRIRGIGSEYSDLLEAAGVDTVPELRQRNAAALYEALVKTNEAKKLVRKLPTADQVAEWVEEAKSLPRVIEYWSVPLPEQKESIMTEEKKSLFDKAIDALTDRDEKEAAAKAAQEKALADAAKKEADARAKIAAEKASAEKAAADKAAAAKAVADKTAADKAAAESAARDAAAKAAAAPKKGVVTVRSLRIRADHNTASEVVAGLVDGDEVTILSTWSDGKNTWAKLDKGWAAMVYDGETYIKLA